MNNVMNENDVRSNSISEFSQIVKSLEDTNFKLDQANAHESEIESHYESKLLNLETQNINGKTLQESYKKKVFECKELNVEVGQLLKSIEELRVENEQMTLKLNNQGTKVEKVASVVGKNKELNEELSLGLVKKDIKIVQLEEQILRLSEVNKAYEDSMNVLVSKNRALDKAERFIDTFVLIKKRATDLINHFKFENRFSMVKSKIEVVLKSDRVKN